MKKCLKEMPKEFQNKFWIGIPEKMPEDCHLIRNSGKNPSGIPAKFLK